ncbi:hypothetical protein [Halorubrum sp. DTA98]|uniref:hypothetical protein n=1 Tax=Halorubrum sp. DTA98 TaxID=3402163 RepID=UPI003AAE73AF
MDKTPNTQGDGPLTRLHRWLLNRSMEGRGCENGACTFDPDRPDDDEGTRR